MCNAPGPTKARRGHPAGGDRKARGHGLGAESGAKLDRTGRYRTIRGPGRASEEVSRNTELNWMQWHGPIHARAYFKTGALNCGWVHCFPLSLYFYPSQIDIDHLWGEESR